MMRDTNTNEAVKHLHEPDVTALISAQILQSGRVDQHLEGQQTQARSAGTRLRCNCYRSHYFENAADGLLGVDPPGPVATTTA
jgi:hypothetical protein